MSDDAALLRHYATTRSERAFTELVERHLDLVYFAALRRCGGDAHRAEDVAQQVFTTLARNAAALASHAVLTGWLYVTTRNVAANLLRAEHTRLAREAKAHAMSDVLAPASVSPAVDWDQLRPVLDGALDALGERDRDAVLLRFFENRPFAEIGAALRVTEDAARMRVDRALDKLRAALTKRGIASTSAALALALAQHAAQVKPAGLAASVTASALGASATIAAAGLGASTSTVAILMSSAKIGTGMLAAIGVLCASLAGNVWLWSRSSASEARAASSSAATAGSARVATAALPVTFADLGAADLSLARDRMRAAGTSEATIRSVLEGVLRRRYREKLSALRAARLETGWWRERDFTRIVTGPVRPTAAEDPKLLREMVLEPLERLLGPDPAEIAEVNARYGFLPEASRRELVRLEADLALVAALDVPARYGGTQTALEQARARLETRRQELIASLSPDQRNEYELRCGPFAPALAQRMASIDGTEEEYRTVFRLIDARVKEKSPNTLRETQSLARVRLDQPMADQLVAALGYDRALDYIWSGAYEFPAYARVAHEAKLPVATAARVVQLAAETVNQASVIHFDTALTLEQKRAAVRALQQKAQSELDVLLPPIVQRKLAPASLAWLTDVGEGRYKSITTTLGGGAGSVLVVGGSSIDKPVSGSWRPTQLLPRRPSGDGNAP
jgi:RNA polymerase sigma factor (sigma-70 family)